jgi:hypothetical protein
VALPPSLLESRFEGGRVRLSWSNAGSAVPWAMLYRRVGQGSWAVYARVEHDAGGNFAFEDAAVRPGELYAYRLAIGTGLALEMSATVEIRIPVARFALDGVLQNPTAGDIAVRLLVGDDAPVAVDLLDVTGRHLFRAAAAAGFGTEIQRGTVADLHAADGVWLLSSVRIAAAVLALDSKPLATDPETTARIPTAAAARRVISTRAEFPGGPRVRAQRTLCGAPGRPRLLVHEEEVVQVA